MGKNEENKYVYYHYDTRKFTESMGYNEENRYMICLLIIDVGNLCEEDYYDSFVLKSLL